MRANASFPHGGPHPTSFPPQTRPTARGGCFHIEAGLALAGSYGNPRPQRFPAASALPSAVLDLVAMDAGNFFSTSRYSENGKRSISEVHP